MNLQYIRYALEIARTGSISKAAENLSVAQPNLSRAVKELESSLGIAIFDRTRTGMTVTPDGERLLSAGERILREVGELETMFEGDSVPRESLHLIFPHADYIVHALASFTRDLPADGRYDLTFRAVGVSESMGLVAGGESRLGVLRFPAHNERYFTDRLAERDLAFETIAELPLVVVTGTALPTASVGRETLNRLTAISTPEVPAESPTEGELPRRRITVNSSEALFALLRADSETYTCTLPLPAPMAAEWGLKQYALADADRPAAPLWRDVLIFPKYYKLSPLDRRLLAELRRVAAECTPI